ncbi:MAG: hypothetical protein M1825_004528 [Sarcosagium campestre]|nr:MAG: hypothetical protein M1825_004528 [Sarcosagium campestre]
MCQKRRRELDIPAHSLTSERPLKRPQTCSPCPPIPKERYGADGGTSGLGASQKSHISHWAEQKIWPKEYFLEDRIHHLLARRKSSGASLTASVTPSDQRPREEKSAPYMNASYPTLLETLGNSYMNKFELGVQDASKALYQNLLRSEYTTPKETLFRDNVFDTACRNLQDKNEARIILDISRLLTPSPEGLAAFGAKDLGVLVESVNEGWNNSIPITNPRPQPDFSVGFRRSAFSDDQLRKMQPLLGDTLSLSYFRATYYMYFPFLSSEVKCGNIGLEIADRQNAHSMTLAVRGIVELFKLAKREKELDRRIQTFSISHDHRTVRLYGYYPVFDGPKTKFYRHHIHTFDITALDGKDRWTTYKFSMAVYHYSLTLLERLRSLIDDLPADLGLELSQLSEPSGLSQQLGNQELAVGPDTQLSQSDLQQITPETSTQERLASENKKKKKKN